MVAQAEERRLNLEVQVALVGLLDQLMALIGTIIGVGVPAPEADLVMVQVRAGLPTASAGVSDTDMVRGLGLGLDPDPALVMGLVVAALTEAGMELGPGLVVPEVAVMEEVATQRRGESMGKERRRHGVEDYRFIYILLIYIDTH